jgi:hypothetical protein
MVLIQCTKCGKSLRKGERHECRIPDAKAIASGTNPRGVEINDAWTLAQQLADTLPPYLADDELTIDRLYEKNKDKMSKQDARDLLEKLVEAGTLDKQERRRKSKGGSHVFVYVVKGKE